MIAAAAFAIGFIVIGMTVLFFAFGGGPRGAREQLHGAQTRSGRRAVFVATLGLSLAFGALIPYLVIDHNRNTQARRATGGLHLTAAEQDGRKLFARNCATCHTLRGANAVGKVGPNLDQFKGLNAALIENAIQIGRARGMGQMPASLLTGEDVKKVATFVAAAAGR